ncbi:MAG: sulfurtransferase complex subunit TusB [Candidatus Hermodarchaeota archaeon]
MKTKNSVIYLYGFSLMSNDKIKSLVKILKDQIKMNTEISIVLIHDGVIGGSKKGETPESLEELLLLPLNLYAIIPDIKARGMDPSDLINKIKGIEYNDLVEILVNTKKIVSWM